MLRVGSGRPVSRRPSRARLTSRLQAPHAKTDEKSDGEYGNDPNACVQRCSVRVELPAAEDDACKREPE